MLKFIIINLLFIKECSSNIQDNYNSITPSPPPASERWTFVSKENRIIRTFSFVDQCGGVGQNMLTPDQKTLFTVTSSLSTITNYLNNSNLVLHTLWSNNGTERWNISITDNNASNFKGILSVSSSNDYITTGYSNGNNTLFIHTFNLNNGSLVWNKTIFGNIQYNVDLLSLFRIVSTNNPSESVIILSPETDIMGRKLMVYELSTGKSINMIYKTYPTSNIYFTTDLKSIFYNIGDGTESNINGNWLSNGSIRVLPDISSNCYGTSLIGVDSYFLAINCGTTCHANCYCSSSNSIFSLKTGNFIGGGQICGGGGSSSGINWIQSLGNGQLLYKSYHDSTSTINSIIDNEQSMYKAGSWVLPTDSTDNSFIPTVFLPNQGLILFTSLLPNNGPTYSKLIAIRMNNGTTAWISEFKWTVIKKSGYESPFNVGTCGSSIYSVYKDNKTLILIDTHYSGHAISIQDGKELFNISLKITPDNYINPYPPSNALSVVSNDAETIYSIVPPNLLLSNNYKNGYIRASYVGNNCDINHYGQGCNKSCECIHEHGKKICDSGVFGTGYCSGSCDKNWTGYNCDNCESIYYGKNCSNIMTCNTGNTPNYNRKIGGICDCGINGTGHCSSCYPRYKGIDCKDCTTEFYGQYCSKSCTCKHGTNSSGINGTGNCKYCNEKKWSGIDCNLCHGKPDAPQCSTKYKPIDCLDPINGKIIRLGCPYMCNSCPPLQPYPPYPIQKYKCISNNCIKISNNTAGGGTLEECKSICKKGYWNCVNGYCIPTLSIGLNRSQCKKICLTN
jgi:hypothetical protein